MSLSNITASPWLRTQDSGLRTQDSGLRTQDSGLRTQITLIKVGKSIASHQFINQLILKLNQNRELMIDTAQNASNHFSLSVMMRTFYPVFALNMVSCAPIFKSIHRRLTRIPTPTSLCKENCDELRFKYDPYHL
ncbi:hypothetical protein EAY73_07690 [Vibrio anguillarum]|nr:hypothetical protein [Vibrio anguillarum]MBF4261786.1 hypothetical protein [Vibrio anguillarum]MBF4368847.1 hypothetical protein [Vibrio anguillarum]MBF4407484.1 hypothetical protein [Vibrio anguillarum]